MRGRYPDVAFSSSPNGKTDRVTFLALSVHLLAAAVWLGAMAYSLAVVQPRSQRFIEDERRREAFAAELAAGARRPVLGVIALLAAPAPGWSRSRPATIRGPGGG